MIVQMVQGAGYVLKGFSLLAKPGLRRFVAVPLFLNILLFSFAIWWAYGLMEHYFIQNLPGWLEWISWLIIPLFGLTILIIVFFTFTIIANLLGSPFNAILSEKVEKYINEQTLDDIQSHGIVVEALKSIGTEMKKLGYLVLWSLPLLILYLIPGLNLFAPILWMLFSAWMMSLQYVDYPMANHGFSFKQERQILRQKKWLAWGFGGTILLMTLIPVLNFFAMPVGVIGATIMWIERFKSTVNGREI